MLRVTDKERGYAILMHDPKKFVDVWVEDRFADQTQGAVTNAHGLAETLGSDTWDSLHHLDFLVMCCCDAVEYQIRSIGYPAPRGADRIGAVSPAKDAFVGA